MCLVVSLQTVHINQLLARSDNEECLPEIKTYDLLSPLSAHLEQHKQHTCYLPRLEVLQVLL